MKFKNIYFNEDVDAQTKAYWLSPSKKIIPVMATHIDTVLRKPEEFGLTQDYIDATAEEFGGKHELRDGGKARDAIMVRMLSKGWVRIRKVVSRNADYWTIQIETGMSHGIPRLIKNTITNWAEKMIQMNSNRGRDSVSVLNTKGDRLFGGGMLVKDQKSIQDIYRFSS